MERRVGKGAIAYHRNQDAFDTAFVGKSGEVSVKVGNLPQDVSPEELCEAFVQEGIDSMTDCYIPQGKRFGFLRFATAAEGKHALQRVVHLHGQQLELELARGSKRTSEEMEFGVHRPAPVHYEAPLGNADASLD